MADIQRYENGTVASSGPLTAEDVQAQIARIQEVMHSVMREGEHYGSIPGTSGKMTLFKSGAEKLSLVFRLAAEYRVRERDLDDGHREYRVTCRLTHRTTGEFVGSGVGVCSTMESRYRYRRGTRACPECGSDGTIIKGKAEYGGGWICFVKKGGCGAKFAENDPAITDQLVGRVENPDIADLYNTVLKMAKKRAHVDAILTATAASDIFTQDLEDFTEPVNEPRQPEPEPKQEPKARRSSATAGELITRQQIESLRKAAKRCGYTDYGLQRLLGKFGFEEFEEITREMYPTIIHMAQDPLERDVYNHEPDTSLSVEERIEMLFGPDDQATRSRSGELDLP